MSAPAETRLVLSLAASPGMSGWRMHNAGYKALGLNYLYLPRKFEGDIAEAMRAIRALGIRGASLTMPFKQSALPHLDALAAEAEAIGAVNTVVNENGTLTGHNTDAPAARLLIERHLPWRRHRLAILGAGGMAHAFAYAAQALGANATVIARDTAKARALAQRFGLHTAPWGDAKALEGAIICNATPVGMAAHEEKTHFFSMETIMGVFEAVAQPAETPLAAAASARGLPLVTGGQLAFAQACLQFTLYTGKEAPADAMKEALHG